MTLDPRHAVAAVFRCLGCALNRIIEARPAGAAVEFHFRHEKWLTASGARKCSSALFLIQCTAMRRLRAMLTHDFILFGRQKLAPFLVSAGHRELFGVHELMLRVRKCCRDGSML